MSVTQATEQRTFVSWRWLNDVWFDWVFIAGLPAIATASAFIAGTLVVFQIVNFHHYIVDALIWKVRSKSLRQTLDLPG